jgi:SET domain-containing protein
MFNHSMHAQNVSWERDVESRCIIYKTLRNIEAGEELCISYGRLWFVDSDADHRDSNGNDHDEDEDEDGLEALSKIELE